MAYDFWFKSGCLCHVKRLESYLNSLFYLVFSDTSLAGVGRVTSCYFQIEVEVQVPQWASCWQLKGSFYYFWVGVKVPCPHIVFTDTVVGMVSLLLRGGESLTLH